MFFSHFQFYSLHFLRCQFLRIGHGGIRSSSTWPNNGPNRQAKHQHSRKHNNHNMSYRFSYFNLKNHKHTTTNLATIRLCQYCYQAPVNWNRTIFKKLLFDCKNDNYRCYESWRVGRSRCRLWSIRFIDRYHDLLTFQINDF